jgi:hypothetical protein
MLAVQCLVIFAAPFATMGYEGVNEAMQVLLFAFTFLVCLISRGPMARALAILAFICSAAGSVLQIAEPSKASLLLFYIGSLSAFIVASDALGYAALAPGEVTVHQVLGAIALYLNIGLMFAAIYRLIWYLTPNSLINIPGGAAWQAHGTILYFSVCDADIDRLWRNRAGSSRRPHAGQCGGHHRTIVSGDSARSPYQARTSRPSVAACPV